MAGSKLKRRLGKPIDEVAGRLVYESTCPAHSGGPGEEHEVCRSSAPTCPEATEAPHADRSIQDNDPSRNTYNRNAVGQIAPPIRIVEEHQKAIDVRGAECIGDGNVATCPAVPFSAPLSTRYCSTRCCE